MSGPGGGGPQSVRGFLTRFGVFMFGALLWFLGALAGELIGGQANSTDLGQYLGRILLVIGIGVVPLTALAWTGYKLWQWRHPSPPELPPPPEVGWPVGLEPPDWRRPGPIYDRDGEVATAVRAVLDTGIAVVHGPRDVGTSAVAEAAVQALIDERRTEDRYVVPLDLRSRSTRSPDDARATAGRILSMFGLDEPANGTPKVLANAAERLHDVLAKQYAVLLLDNVAVVDEIKWLLPQWTERNNRQPWLVIAGETAIGSVVPGSSQVPVDPLSMDGMRKIWHADTDTAPEEPAHPVPTRRRPSLVRWVRDWLRPRPDQPPAAPPATPDPIDKLLAVCGGRPRAIKAVAREIAGTDRDGEVSNLLASLHTGENPLVGIWRAILLRTEDSLGPDAVWLLRALAVLPVTALTTDAITAVMAAHTPDAEQGPAGAPPAPFEELRDRGFVQDVGDRYRLPQEIRWAITGKADKTKNDEIARVAVPELVRHHADRVVRRANQLDVRSVGARAAAWLHEEEPTLRPLFSSESYQDGAVLLAVLDDLARIAGALEYWYVREQQADGLLKVSTELGELAGRVKRNGLVALAAARKATAYRMVGQRAKADELLSLVAGEARVTTDHDLATELVTRLHVEKALLAMAGGESTRDGTEVRGALEEIAEGGRHPGAGIAMVNLGALHLAADSPDAATLLDRAEAMARVRDDVGCQAQAVELRGIAVSKSDLHAAVSLWQEAQQLFEAIGEEQGQARCLQHLGAAALVDPTVAARLADDPDDADPAATALPLLRRSKQLRAGQPDTALVDEYLRLATDGQALPPD